MLTSLGILAGAVGNCGVTRCCREEGLRYSTGTHTLQRHPAIPRCQRVVHAFNQLDEWVSVKPSVAGIVLVFYTVSSGPQSSAESRI